MIFLVFSILAGLVAIIALLVVLASKEAETRHGALVIMGIAVIATAGAIVWGSIMTVPVGHIAVMSRFGRLTGEVKNNGLSGKAMIDTPIIMSIQTQKNETLNEAASKDLQDVKTTIAVNFKIDPARAPEILRTLGMDYWNVFAAPAEQETVKSITATYNAEDMVLRREEIKLAISDALTKKFAERGILTEAINITDFKFSPEFTAAIEAKVVAAQNVAQAENKLLQIKVEAEQAVAKAQGDANAAITRAEGQAKANDTIAKSLTPDVLQYFFLDKLGTDVKVVVVPSNQQLTISVPQP